MKNFTGLGVSPFFCGRLGERNILSPTDIQERVIPLIAAGEQVLFRSATGTGKTFAYLLPMLARLLEDKEGPPAPGGAAPLMLICAPTFELCSQIKSEADFLLKGITPPPRINLLIGSANMNRQIESLKKDKPLIVAGNPGRLLTLAKMGKLKLRRIKFLVLDEGDRLMADELAGETLELVRMLAARAGESGLDRGGPVRPGGPLFASCSATITVKSMEKLLPVLGGTPRVIESSGQEVLRERIEHWALFSEDRRKIQSLRAFLAAVKPKKALIFSDAGAGRGGRPGIIASQLQYHKISAACLYGDMDKKARKEAIDGFRSGKIPVLAATDLAARGLDVPGVTHVIALDVPEDDEAYIHRAGRTGRAGRRGVMVTIGGADEMRRLARVEKRLGICVHPKELYRGNLTDTGCQGSSG